MLNLARTGTLQAPLPYWMNKLQDRKYSSSWASFILKFGFLMKKISYPKAWDRNNAISSFDKSNAGFFLDIFFSSLLLEELGNHEDFILWEIGFARGDLAFSSESSFSKISWAFLHPIPLAGSGARLEPPSLLLCISVFPVPRRLMASKALCLQTPPSTAQQSSAQCSEQWDRLLTAVGEMLESKHSRESTVQSSMCSS